LTQGKVLPLQLATAAAAADAVGTATKSKRRSVEKHFIFEKFV